LNFPFYIAKRYLFSKSSNNAINIITGIASIGIIVGTMALFVVLSVFSGLRDFSLSFSNDFDPDLKVVPETGKYFTVTPNQERQLKNLAGVASYSKIVEERVLFFFKGKELVSCLKGVDSNFTKTNSLLRKDIYNGQWLKPNSYQVVVGYGITEKLSLGLFDFNNPFEVYVPRKGSGVIEREEEAFYKSNLIPVGIYAISEDLDSKYVFCDLTLAQELLELKANQVSGIELKLKRAIDEQLVKSKLDAIFKNKTIVKNRSELNATLHKMLNTENLAVYLILTLVIIMFLFAFSGAIIMMIIDKEDNLKTLFHLGVETKALKKIFLFQGTLLCAIGGIVGLVLGSAIVLLQQQLKLIMITETLAYPVRFSLQNIGIVLATIVTLGFLASLIASNGAGKKVKE
jgi:lipoprotein-releasing system permease protein